MKKIWNHYCKEYSSIINNRTLDIKIKLEEKGYSKEDALKKAKKQAMIEFNICLLIALLLTIVFISNVYNALI